MNRGARWIFGLVSLAVLVISMLREMQIAAIGGLAGLFVALAPTVFENLLERIRRLGPAEFYPPAVREALASLPEATRAKAEQDAQNRMKRLEGAMGSLPRLLNQIVAELAALGVRTTALEEETAALRARIQ